MFYLPISSYGCYEYLGNGVIRAFPTRPSRPSSSSGGYYTYNYYDYYINDNYLYRQGSANYYYNTTLPTCSLNGKITTDFWYRQDIDRIMLLFTLISLFVILIPILIFKKLFKKGRF